MSAILVISPEPWETHNVSKHHYARALAARGWTVFFLEPPSPATKRLEINPATDASGVLVVSGPRVAPGLRFMPAPLRRKLEAKWLAALEKQADVSVSTIWLFENSRFFDMQFAGSRLKIYHQVDLNQNFHPETAAATADVCFCTTEIIRSRLRTVRQDVHKVHHATWISDGGSCLSAGPELPSADIKAAYVGNLDMRYLDVAGLAQLVCAFPRVSFHMVGGYTAHTPLYKLLRNQPNVTWWGRLPHAQVARILAQADIHLVAYKASASLDQASPHKFMEYLLSGKVVVCSYTDEYKDKRHLVEMAEANESLSDIFARVVGDLSVYNSELRQAERRTFAREHSYENQLARIERIVAESTNRCI